MSPIARVGDRCPARGEARETYAAYLRGLNTAADRVARREAGPVPFASHLRSINEMEAAAWRARTLEVAGVPGAGMYAKPAPVGDRVPEPVGRASLPRLGDVTPTKDVAIHEVIQRAYGARNLLSRGAVIDLAG